MDKKIQAFLSKEKIAVIGSFRNEGKPAFRIVKALMEMGRDVYPVNPGKKEVLGLKVYPSVSDLPNDIEALDIVTSPEVTEKIIQSSRDKGIDLVWIQPGAESDKAIKYCKENGITCIHNVCVMAESLS